MEMDERKYGSTSIKPAYISSRSYFSWVLIGEEKKDRQIRSEINQEKLRKRKNGFLKIKNW